MTRLSSYSPSSPPFPAIKKSPHPLFEGAEWSFERLEKAYHAITEIALGEMGLSIYPNQIEVITAEQMLDAYSSIGLPLIYRHWSFGKHFARDEAMYRHGYTNLAYEIVINSNPCISYNMEENSMTMQTMVMAHAAFGHNHFFKNNYLFQQWTDAEGILSYMQFAKDFVAKCEERHGLMAVEQTLDGAHALMDHGVNRYSRPRKPNYARELARQHQRQDYQEQHYNDLWRTLPHKADPVQSTIDPAKFASSPAPHEQILGLPEENLLYFLEKHSPILEGWQREILRIVRNLAQYFYPQKQTKAMNEGCATFVHYEIMNRLYDKGLLTDGAMLEFIDYHTRVVTQMPFNDRRYGGVNPYALGFAMMQDIRRMCEQPEGEDKEFAPDIAGRGDYMAVLRDIWANYRDESFILQYLSPKLIRQFKFFYIEDDEHSTHLKVEAIHDAPGYKRIRQALARQYDLSCREPDIEVLEANLAKERTLLLRHRLRHGIHLERKSAHAVLAYIAALWGYPVRLIVEDGQTGRVVDEKVVNPP
jgi:stage V sporulation protein R